MSSTAELGKDTLVRAPAGPQAVLTMRQARRAQGVAARALVVALILSLAGVVAVATAFELEAVLTWVLAIDCDLIIPLTTVALVRTAHPSWANSPQGQVGSRARRVGRPVW